MSEGLWDGEQRHVVHCLPMEEGLPKVHRLTVEIMQRIWGGGGQQPDADCCNCTVSLPIFPSSDVVLGVLVSWGVFLFVFFFF